MDKKEYTIIEWLHYPDNKTAVVMAESADDAMKMYNQDFYDSANSYVNCPLKESIVDIFSVRDDDPVLRGYKWV